MSTSTGGVTEGGWGVPRLDGRKAEQRQTDPASKSKICLCFRHLGEEGVEDRLRFFRTGEPAAEVAEAVEAAEHGWVGITDVMPCAVSRSTGEAICVGGGSSCMSADDQRP